MKKLLSFFMLFCIATMLCLVVFANEPTVYVSAFGNDANTGTIDAPVKSLYAAMRALPNGGKAVIMDPLSLTEANNELPKVDGLITVTSLADKDYRTAENGSAAIYLHGHVQLKSPIRFENLHIIACEPNLVFLCNGYYACFGEGITTAAAESSDTLPGITGGAQGRYPANDCYVEICSGSWYRIRGGHRGTAAEQNGDTTLVIRGGTFTNTVDVGGDTATNGNAYLYIYGGTFSASVNIASSANINGNAYASIYGGIFKKAFRASRGGIISGDCTISVFGSGSIPVQQDTGNIGGSSTLYVENALSATGSNKPCLMTAAECAARTAADTDAIAAVTDKMCAVKYTVAFADRDTTPCSTITKPTAESIMRGDANGDNRLSLKDALLALHGLFDATGTEAADADDDGRTTLLDVLLILRATLNGKSGVTYTVDDRVSAAISLYGATWERDRLSHGFAFGTVNTDAYELYADVVLDTNAVVGLYFGCDAPDPRSINGYYFEVNTVRNVLSVYSITSGNYRTVGEKKLDLLANKARISVVYANDRAQLYFDDNVYTLSDFFDFDLAFASHGNAIGVYIENASAALPVCVPRQAPDGETYTNEIINNLTDPEIFYENGRYYIFGAGAKGVQCYSTADFQNFTDEGLVLKKGDAYGGASGFVAGNIVKQGEYYYLFYLSSDASHSTATTAYASAKSLTGPYTNPEMQPLVPDSDIIGGQPFVDEDGTVYLIYTRTTGGNETYGAVVHLKDGKATLDRTTEQFLLGISQEWEYARACVVECGFLVKHNGLYYLLYAGGNYNSTYGVGYAVSQNPLGPYTKYAHNPILTSNDQSFGVGAASVFPSPDGSEHFIIHLRNFSPTQVRPLQTCIDRIRFVRDPRGGEDLLEIAGPSVTPQNLPSGIGIPSNIDYQTARFHW